MRQNWVDFDRSMEHNHLILDSGTLERVASMGIFHGKLRSSCWLAEVIFVIGQLELGIFIVGLRFGEHFAS